MDFLEKISKPLKYDSFIGDVLFKATLYKKSNILITAPRRSKLEYTFYGLDELISNNSNRLGDMVCRRVNNPRSRIEFYNGSTIIGLVAHSSHLRGLRPNYIYIINGNDISMEIYETCILPYKWTNRTEIYSVYL